MHVKGITLLLLIAIVGCQAQLEPNRAQPDLNVYQVVLRDLETKTPEETQLQGETVWVDPSSCQGDSLFYSWGSEITIDPELQAALSGENQRVIQFDATELASPKTRIAKIESFDDFFDLKAEQGLTDAKCMVQFWRAGFSRDGKRAVVRFYYGPSPHGAVGTYLLQLTESGWTITASTLSYYA